MQCRAAAARLADKIGFQLLSEILHSEFSFSQLLAQAAVVYNDIPPTVSTNWVGPVEYPSYIEAEKEAYLRDSEWGQDIAGK
eukprot:402526-Hanusia_phi.AAC.3